jgi:metal-sulfur cluster biosynthetic enzyme
MPNALQTPDAIMATLDQIKDPCSVANGTPMGLAEMGLIGALDIMATGEVAIEMRLTSPFCHMIGFFKTEAERLLMNLPGVTSVSLRGDNGLDWSPEHMTPVAQARRAHRLKSMQANAISN